MRAHAPLPPPATAGEDVATVIAATFYLMTCHATKPCPALAAMIRCHLRRLAAVDLPPGLARTCGELAARWDRLSPGPSHAPQLH